MARILWIGETRFYRALIEELRDDEWIPLYAFGPYTQKNQAQDREAGRHGSKYAAGTRRKRTQVQDVSVVPGFEVEIVWRDV